MCCISSVLDVHHQHRKADVTNAARTGGKDQKTIVMETWSTILTYIHLTSPADCQTFIFGFSFTATLYLVCVSVRQWKRARVCVWHSTGILSSSHPPSVCGELISLLHSCRASTEQPENKETGRREQLPPKRLISRWLQTSIMKEALLLMSFVVHNLDILTADAERHPTQLEEEYGVKSGSA